jgi:hypothetical protein
VDPVIPRKTELSPVVEPREVQELMLNKVELVQMLKQEFPTEVAKGKIKLVASVHPEKQELPAEIRAGKLTSNRPVA